MLNCQANQTDKSIGRIGLTSYLIKLIISSVPEEIDIYSFIKPAFIVIKSSVMCMA